MPAGIVAQGVGRDASQQTLTNARLTYNALLAGQEALGSRSRIGLMVKAWNATAYAKFVDKSVTDISGVTVSSSDHHDQIPVGGAYFMPVGPGVEPVFTGTVSAVEIYGSYN